MGSGLFAVKNSETPRIEEVEMLPRLYREGEYNYTPVILSNGKLEHCTLAPISGYYFETEETIHTEKYGDIPVVSSITPVTAKVAEVVATFAVNKFMPRRNYNWSLPPYDFFKGVENTYTHRNETLCFTPEAVEECQKLFSEWEKENDEITKLWESQYLPVGTTVFNSPKGEVKILRLKRNPNSTCSYVVGTDAKNCTHIHQYGISEYMNLEMPAVVEDVRFGFHPEIEFLMQSQWVSVSVLADMMKPIDF